LYSILKNPTEYERDILSAKFTANTRLVSPDLLLGVSWYLPEGCVG
jgi:hypothetical protein